MAGRKVNNSDQLSERMHAIAAELTAMAEVLREDARRVGQQAGWASRAFIRLRYADDLAGAGRLLVTWALEMGREDENGLKAPGA